MRANKIAVLATCVITIGSLSICAYFYPAKPLIYDFSLACFGSALLGLVVAYISYSAERRNSMELFWREGINIIVCIRKIRYLAFDEPLELIRECLDEETGLNFFEPEKHEAKEKMLDWLEQNRCTDNGDPDYLKHLENYYQNLIEGFQSELLSCAQTYINFSETLIGELSNTYSRLDFIAANRTIRESAYDNVYHPIYDFHVRCCEDANRLRRCIDEHRVSSKCLNIVLQLQESLFIEDFGRVYLQFADNLDKELETFRSKIYGVSPEYRDPVPVNGLFFEDGITKEKMHRERVGRETMRFEI